MSTLEVGTRQARIRINSRLNPDSLTKPLETALSKPLHITPEFFTRKLAKLKNISSVIGMEELKQRLLMAENRVIMPEIEKAPHVDTIIIEIPNPHKDILEKLARVNRIMQRGRRGSRCLAQPEHSPKNCQGRVHLKKSGSGSQSGSINQPNIRIVDKSPEGNSKQTGIAKSEQGINQKSLESKLRAA
jgi:hypothetical protein